MAEESDECMAQVRAALADKEREALDVIKEDLSQWLMKLLQRVVTSSDFMKVLDTGVVLCKLAEMIQQQACKRNEDVKRKWKFHVPMEPLNCNTHACSGSNLGKFHSRVNTSNFIKWCRELGVEEAVIFESEGLVLHKDEKRVILCLLELARFAERVGLPPPQLVRMEREIELLEEGGTIDETYQPEGAQILNNEESPIQPILLEDLCKMACNENGNSNGFDHMHEDSLSPCPSPTMCFPSSSSPSPKHSTSRIPVRTPSSTVKYRKSLSPRSRSASVPSKAEMRKRWRNDGETKRCPEEGKEKESEGAATGDSGGSVGSPGKRQRVGSRRSLGSRVAECEVKVESTATVEERVMKRVKECTCKNKIVVVSLGKGKFTVKGASGRTMTVYARVRFRFIK